MGDFIPGMEEDTLHNESIISLMQRYAAISLRYLLCIEVRMKNSQEESN